MMPEWFLYFGIAIATAAAIIASQALISGSFTLISEAMRLNLWPKCKIVFPTEARGQLFIPAINLMFRKVVEDLVANREVNITSRYESLERSNIVGDFSFIVMEKFLSQDNDLPILERLVMKLYFWLKDISLSEERGFGLDASNVIVEKFPLIVALVTDLRLKRLK
jgi:K+ transporter